MLALREVLDDACAQGGTEALALAELAANKFLRWCEDAAHRAKAAPSAAAFAKTYGEMVLVGGLDPRRALPVLETAWKYRDDAGYRACDLALTLADTYRVVEDHAAAQSALDHYAGLRDTPRWAEWQKNDTKRCLLEIDDLQHECRRAMLESCLGNPDGVLQHLRRAKAILDSEHWKPEPEWRELIAGAWCDAEVTLLLSRIDCFCNLEQFGRAASEAAKAAQRAGELGRDVPQLPLYLALAQSWDAGSSAADRTAAERALERLARDPNAAIRKQALRRLAQLAASRGEPDLAAGWLDQLEALDGHLSSDDTSLRTELLLQRDAVAPCKREHLLAQRDAQRAAFEELLAHWQRTPRRLSGNGFLHYLERREVIGQLVAITLRASTEPGEAPPEAAVAEALGHVLRAQTLGTLAHRLGTTAPAVADVKACLAPGHGVVLYLPTHATTHVFVIDQRCVSHHALDRGAVAMRTDLEPFLAALADATDRIDHSPDDARTLAASLGKLGARLSQTLFPAAVRARVDGWSALTVVGSELLYGAPAGSADAGYSNYLPIECLPWDERTTFGERFAIDHDTSLPVWWQLGQRAAPTSAQSRVCLFGCLTPAGAEHDPARPVADGDHIGPALVRVGAPFERCESHFDERCSLARVAPATASREHAAPSIAVFVTHCGYDANLEAGAFLQMHDGRLDCAATQALGVPGRPFADIVVLAACSAAKGPTRAGDSFANLGGAFLLAGATTIVQSRFDLPLHGTCAVLDELMERLAHGESPAAALQAARCAARKGSEDPLIAYRTGVLQVHGFGQAPPRR